MTRCPNCYAAMPLIVDKCVKCHRPVQRFTPIESPFRPYGPREGDRLALPINRNRHRAPKRPGFIARAWRWYATAPDWFRVLVPWFVALAMLATLPIFVLWV